MSVVFMLCASAAGYTLLRTPADATAAGRGAFKFSARSSPPRLQQQVPIDGLLGVDMQRRLGEITFSELVSSMPDRESVLSGKGAAKASVGPGAVVVGLFFGQLSRGAAAGTRVLIKAYSSEENNALATARAAATGASSTESRMRERLAAIASARGGNDAIDDGSDSGAGSGKDDSLRRALEASLSSDGTSLAEALAENEYAAHTRVQAMSVDVEKAGLSRLIGRFCPDYRESESQMILHIFPWRGESTRMALPTALPPTLQTWAAARQRGATLAQSTWKGVPLRACQQRGRFVREAMRGALVGLASLHGCHLLHQALSPAAIAISTEDDRKGEKAGLGRLTELAFCREASSLRLAYRVDAQVSASDCF